MVDHKLKETFPNLVLGYEIDLQKHLEVFQAMNEEMYTTDCDECEYEACSEGKL